MSLKIKKIETYISRKMETRRNSSKEITEISNKECDKGRQSSSNIKTRDYKGTLRYEGHGKRECRRGMQRKKDAMKLLMEKNKTEWKEYQRRDTWTLCQVNEHKMD